LLASIKTSFRVAPITALIVLLPTSAHTLGPVVSAIDRVLEITLGNLVGVAVALLILPSRAHTLLTEAAAQVVRLNAELVTLLLNGVLADAGAIGTPALHARIRASLKQVESAADEAARERKSHLTDAPDPEPLVRTLYRVRHDFVMIGRAAASPLDERIRVRLATCIAQIRDAAQTFLVALADALQMRGSPPSATAFDESLAALVSEMETMRGEHFLEPLPAEAVARLYALRFSLEQLRQDLDDLDARTREMMLKRKDSDGATRQPPDGG
ncbi:FUSC family protein, partial [Corallococcus exiguus]|nr:FUSC family protein [Corallococcus exiguus]